MTSYEARKVLRDLLATRPAFLQSLPLAVLIDRIHNPVRSGDGYEEDDDGRLVPTAEAELVVEDSGEVEASGKRPQTQCRQMMLEVAGCMHRGFVSSCGCTVAYV